MPNFTISFKAMGSHIQAWLNTPTLDDAQILQEVPMWFEAWEQQFSRFRTDSDLSELNRRTGQWVEVAPDMFEVISLAVRAIEETNGIKHSVTITTVKMLTDLWLKDSAFQYFLISFLIIGSFHFVEIELGFGVLSRPTQIAT